MSEASQPGPLVALSQGTADLVARTEASVVGVHGGRASSSGFLWREGLVVTAEETSPRPSTEGETANTGDRAADVADPTSVPQPLDETSTTDGARHGGNGTQTVDEGPGGDAAPDRGA